MEENPKLFTPYVAPDQQMKEFTLKAIVVGALFGILFGAATVYLALKAGLTVSASIPIAVLAISLGRRFLRTTILENNIIQTTGSAGESVAAGVVFTLPAFLFLSETGPGTTTGTEYFNYWTIFTLATFGGILGTLMMIPLRRSLIVQEHRTLPYPEGTACASVLIAGERGGDFARPAFQGLGFALLYALLQKVIHVIAETPTWISAQANKYIPSLQVSGEITPEYMGVGYIIGPRIAGVLVAGGVLAWCALIPLLAFLVPAEAIALQQIKLGMLPDLATKGGRGGWDPETQTFANYAEAIYRAYIRQIGAGAVAAGGFITLIKTLPTIVEAFRGSMKSLQERATMTISRTENDLSFRVVIFGSLGLVALLAFLPQIPGETLLNKVIISVLIVVFGFFFVTVSSRIVGLIGSSNNPISGMTIATIMGTALVFIAVGWTGKIYEPLALVVGGMICVAAANAGATSQDLKTGFIVGATPRYQQIALFIGVLVSSVVIGFTLKYLDTPTPDLAAQGIDHAIGTKYNAPQATLMATIIKGLLSFNLDWQFVVVGIFAALTLELCGVRSLSFAVGLYLPLSTTLPIFAGGVLKAIVDRRLKMKSAAAGHDDELGKGSLFATGLVAGGALAGVIVALLSVNSHVYEALQRISAEPLLVQTLGQGGYYLLGVGCFVGMGILLYMLGTQKNAITKD